MPSHAAVCIAGEVLLAHSLGQIENTARYRRKLEKRIDVLIEIAAQVSRGPQAQTNRDDSRGVILRAPHQKEEE